MVCEKIIIIGATGQVAAAAALVAQEKGHKVSLAMRDTKKTIPGFTPEQEQNAGFERVYADLTKPDSIRDAVEKTGAKRAFLYCLIGDDLRPSIEALKTAGIEFVVFNSSSSVKGDLRAIAKSDYIAWHHAQVEIALAEVFGTSNYIAVRPGAFASNLFTWKNMAKKGQFTIVYPDAVFGYITPQDIGRVCGALLATGPQVLETKAGLNIVNLTGPEPLSQREAAEMIGKAIGKELPVVSLSEEGGVQFFVDSFGIPGFAAKGMVQTLKAMAEKGRSHEMYQGDLYEEARGNVERYTGRPSTKLIQWLEDNSEAFKHEG